MQLYYYAVGWVAGTSPGYQGPLGRVVEMMTTDPHRDDDLPSHRLLADSCGSELIWGYTYDPAPSPGRMHVRCFTADGTPAIWLEGPDGTRVWEPAPNCPPEIAAASRADIERQREEIERFWLTDMLTRWHGLTMTQDGPLITLMCYPGTAASFIRVIGLRQHAVNPPIEPGSVALVATPVPALELWADRHRRWRSRIPLEGLIWQ